MADPVEMIRARNVAIMHVCFEVVAILFCRSVWCVVAAIFAIPSSSTVACCCKQRCSYAVWSIFGGLVFFLHAVAAAIEALGRDEYYDGDPSAFILLVQIFLCLLSLIVMHYGTKLTSLVREPIFPVEMQGGDMEVTRQVGAYPPEVPYAQARLSP